MEAASDPGQVILDEIAALEVERARIEARIAHRMLAFDDVRRTESERHADPRVAEIERSFAADELGVALHLPTKVVQDRLAQLRRVRSLLPLTWVAFLVGDIDAYRVSLITAAAHKVRGDNHHLIHLDAAVGDYASSHTVSQLRGWLNRFVARWAPDRCAARDEHAKRAVWVRPGDDGMSWLTAYLPTADAERIDAALTQRARALSDDDRTIDQRRADLFVDLLLGRGADGASTSARAVVGITVPVTSLTGLDDLPGESFDGSFALPADMVRDLLADPDTLWFRILTDPLGRVLDTTEPRPFPSDALRTAVQARDGTCRFPTCTQPAITCDLDHEIPRPDGPTHGDNLRALCRRHHNIKTHRVAEPTDVAMRRRTPSRVEVDLAHFITDWHYAA